MSPSRADRRQTSAGAWLLLGLVCTSILSGCASPQVVPAATVELRPGIERPGDDRLQARMPDGTRLPLRVWKTRRAPSAVMLALHGFNDYGNAFAILGERLAADGIITYAVDQRGFGATLKSGRWHGSDRLAQDIRVLLSLLRDRYPHRPVFLLGESMGAAAIMAATAQGQLPADGLVLVAPAVWARDTMPAYQRIALELTVRTVPGLRLTGKGVPIHPSDNLEMLRALGADPLVIKATRIDALWGVTNLMDRALQAAPALDQERLGLPVLLLYGERDSIIPPAAFCRLVEDLPRGPAAPRLVLYRHGWHMLHRDRQGARVRHDIATWLLAPSEPLPSGEEVSLDGERLTGFCAKASQ